MSRSVERDAVRESLKGERFMDLIAELGGDVRKSRGNGRHPRIPCLLHGGKDANMVLTPDTGLWNCLSTCGGGDVFRLVEKTKGMSFKEALLWLNEWLGGTALPSAPRPQAPQAPDVDTGPLMRAIWGRVHDAPWSERALAYLASRGIEPDAPYALGCRDWTTRREALREVFSIASGDELEAAGFGRYGLWRPLQGLLDGTVVGGDDRTWMPSEWEGVAVPFFAWDADVPTKWRWRLYDTVAGEESQGKARSPIGGGADLLGIAHPSLSGGEVRLADFGATRAVLIVEGEPDWWSATEVVDGRAVVLGVTGASHAWRRHWPTFQQMHAKGVRLVAVAVHHGRRLAACVGCRKLLRSDLPTCPHCAAPNDPQRIDGVGHGELLANAIADECAHVGIAYVRRLPSEAHDLNDIHRTGGLRAWVDEVLSPLSRLRGDA